MISSIVTSPLPLTSSAGQAEIGRSPRAMFTATISSLMVTMPSPLQSPTHAIAVGVGDGGGVIVGESVEVATGVGDAVRVAVAV